VHLPRPLELPPASAGASPAVRAGRFLLRTWRGRGLLASLLIVALDMAGVAMPGPLMALESIGPDAAPATPALVRALKDREGLVRQRAAIALGSIGPGARDALPALSEASRVDLVRPAAEEAIRKITTPH